MYSVLCILLSVSFLFIASPSYAQWTAPDEGEFVWPVDVLETGDNGYLVLGGALNPANPTHTDTWVAKLNSGGDIEWVDFYGGSESDLANAAYQTSDGGYVVAGYIYSPTTKLSDGWLMKLDSAGNQEWQNSYGGDGNDLFNTVQQTGDGGYVLAGASWAGGMGADGWVLKVNSAGDVDWQKTIGKGGDDFINSVVQTGDGGYIVVGDTTSPDTGQTDGWMVRLNALGDKQWDKTFGGASNEEINAIWSTSDGGYIVGGSTDGPGNEDLWVLKLSSTGDTEWQVTQGGEGADEALSIAETSDGGYIVAGMTTSYGSNGDGWVLKLDSEGNVQWTKTYGADLYDVITTVEPTDDGGYIISGGTYSFGPDGNDLGKASWVAKLNSQGDVQWYRSEWEK